MSEQLFCVMDDVKTDVEMTPEISRIFEEGLQEVQQEYAYLFKDKKDILSKLPLDHNKKKQYSYVEGDRL